MGPARPGGALHPVHSALSTHLARSLTLADFDVTVSSRQREGHTLGHAFLRVAVLASGGLSHFVVLEDWTGGSWS